MSATATNLRAVGEPPGGADRRSQPARPAIRISDLQKSFGTLVAIDHVSVDIEPGEFFMIVGPSGCGKTTLLRILAGLETATAGTIEIDTPAGLGPAGKFHGVPGRLDLPLDDGVEQRRLRAAHAQRAGRRHQGAGRPLSRRAPG